VLIIPKNEKKPLKMTGKQKYENLGGLSQTASKESKIRPLLLILNEQQ